MPTPNGWPNKLSLIAMTELSTRMHIHLLAEPQILLSQDTLMNVTFESVADKLQSFDRMYFEMDGSFVWTGNSPLAWQLDGMVYDLGQQIQRIELKGQCPIDPWRQLLHAFNYPRQPLHAYDLLSSQFITIAQLESHLWSS